VRINDNAKLNERSVIENSSIENRDKCYSIEVNLDSQWKIYLQRFSNIEF